MYTKLRTKLRNIYVRRKGSRVATKKHITKTTSVLVSKIREKETHGKAKYFPLHQNTKIKKAGFTAFDILPRPIDIDNSILASL